MSSSKTKEILFLTGASGQLGQAIYKKLCNEYDIFSLDISYSNEQTNSRILKIDISDPSEVSNLFSSINPDVIINNAGISVFTSFMDRCEEELDHVYEVNLKGTINMINSFARANKENKKLKRIVNISSLYGVVSADPRIYTDCDRNSPEIYAATKAGVIQLTKYYCVHLRDMNVRVNCISPGGIFNPNDPQGDDFIKNYSERCPMKKMGSAEDIADGVCFLSSKESSYINGHNLVIDGGFTAW